VRETDRAEVQKAGALHERWSNTDNFLDGPGEKERGTRARYEGEVAALTTTSRCEPNTNNGGKKRFNKFIKPHPNTAKSEKGNPSLSKKARQARPAKEEDSKKSNLLKKGKVA